jgi:hypothetical protein
MVGTGALYVSGSSCVESNIAAKNRREVTLEW